MGENKHKHSMWLSDELWADVQAAYRADGCSTFNQFVEKGLRFYLGYLKTKDAGEYLPRVLAQTLDGKLGALGSRIGSVLFKLAVNDDMLTHVLAAGTEVDELAALDKLRVQCVNETKQTHGSVEFKDAYLFEKGL